MVMAITVSCLLFSQTRFFLLFFFSTMNSRAQLPANSATDFSCSADSPPSCKTYAAYFAQPPIFLDLRNISDLFEVSGLSIARASNLVSEDSLLTAGQLLLVPIACGCSSNQYTANITYQIKKGDSFYLVSVTSFENLTDWHVVEDMNPSRDPNLLQIGVEVVIPVFCKCPSKINVENGIKYLVTYTWQPDDDVLHVSNKFGASPADMIAENNYKNFSAEVYLPALIPVSQLPLLLQPLSSPP